MRPKTSLERLAFKIAEHVCDMPHKYSCDADSLYKHIWAILPSDMESIADEQELFDKSISGSPPAPKGPSLLGRLREAVHADKGTPLDTVIEAAIAKINEHDQIRSKTCDAHHQDALNFNGCVYCDRLKQVDYSIQLQRFVEYLIRGETPSSDVLAACPHHAKMLEER